MKTLLIPKEMEVLQYINEGYSQSEIAEELCRSVSTVKSHVGRILDKMQEPNSQRAAEKATKLGILKVKKQSKTI